MTENQPSQRGQDPQPPLFQVPTRRVRAFWGGMLAGTAIGGALAIVLRVIQQASPGGGVPIGPSVFFVLVLGLVIGLGLGIAFAALVPAKAADLAATRPVAPAEQPPAQSA